MPPDYSGILGSFGQPQQSFYPSQVPGQQGEFAGWQQPSYGGISSFNGAQPPQGMFGQTRDWLGKDGNLGAVFGGIQALGSTWLGFQQMKQAKEALKFQKHAYNTNLTNSTQAYNTSLEDRINGRTADYDGKAGDVQAYLASHKLKKPGG